MKMQRNGGKRPRSGKQGAKDNPSHLRASLQPPAVAAPRAAKGARVAADLAAQVRLDRVGGFRARTDRPRAEPTSATSMIAENGRAAESRAEAAIIPRAIPRPLTPRPDLQLPGISVENVDWDDASDPAYLSPLSRWGRLERELMRRLKELGVTDPRCRVDLKEGRAVWVDELGSPVVEARAQILCTLALPSLALTMGWADPVLASVSLARFDGIPEEQNLLDDESARDIALRAADASGAEYVFRMPAPNVDYFLGVRSLRPAAGALSLTPGSPVGLVLRGLADLRGAVGSSASELGGVRPGASPPISWGTQSTHALRARFVELGRVLAERATTDFRETEWVGRLQRASKLLTTLAARLNPPTFTAIAAGFPAADSLSRDVAIELTDALALLADEWSAFTS
ncbi:MAG: hypothetical protein U0414_09940 [Polyangiaceae bacterium]